MNDEQTQPANLPPPSASGYTPWLHWLALAFMALTFVLVCWGGTVTSKGAGLAVPDAPNTYGHNMLTFPVSEWRGGVFWEHTHRLLGFAVGVAGSIMCWVLLAHRRQRPGLAWFAVATLALIVVQGLMGIWRVTEISTGWAILHGINGQVVLCMTAIIAVVTSRRWLAVGQRDGSEAHKQDASCAASGCLCRRAFVPSCLVLIAVLFIQLALGSAVRHTEAGLAIPDFPTSYGGFLPPMSQEAIDDAIAHLPYDEFTASYSAMQVHLHFTHRLWAVVVLAAAVWLITRLLRVTRANIIVASCLAIALLLIVQVALGASVIWTGRHPEVATAHQATGAAILAIAVCLAFWVHRLPLLRTTERDASYPMVVGLKGAGA